MTLSWISHSCVSFAVLYHCGKSAFYSASHILSCGLFFIYTYASFCGKCHSGFKCVLVLECCCMGSRCASAHYLTRTPAAMSINNKSCNLAFCISETRYFFPCISGGYFIFGETWITWPVNTENKALKTWRMCPLGCIFLLTYQESQLCVKNKIWNANSKG